MTQNWLEDITTKCCSTQMPLKLLCGITNLPASETGASNGPPASLSPLSSWVDKFRAKLGQLTNTARQLAVCNRYLLCVYKKNPLCQTDDGEVEERLTRHEVRIMQQTMHIIACNTAFLSFFFIQPCPILSVGSR